MHVCIHWSEVQQSQLTAFAISMQKVFLIYVLFFFGLNYSKAENVDMTIRAIGNTILVEIPDTLVKSLFVFTEDAHKCYPSYNCTLSASVLIEIPKTFKRNEEFNLFGLIETQTQVIAKEFKILIDENGRVHKKNVSTSQDIEHRAPDTQKNVFNDDFDDTQFTNWIYSMYARTLSLHHEPVAFTNSLSNAYTKDGKLHIRVTWNSYTEKLSFDNCTVPGNDILRCGPFGNKRTGPPTPPLSSALLHSNFNIQLGRIDIRAKMPKGPWLFPVLALYQKDKPVERDHVNHIKIYQRGNPRLFNNNNDQIGYNKVFAGVYPDEDNEDPRVYHRDLNISEYDTFNTYTIIVKREEIVFKINDYIIGSTSNTYKESAWYIVIGLTVGGPKNFHDYYSKDALNLESPQLALEFFENQDSINELWTHPELVIDYVHVSPV